MNSDLARRKAERHSEKLREVEDFYRGLAAEDFLGANLMHLEPGMAGWAFSGNDIGTARFRGGQKVEHQLRRRIAIGKRMGATVLSG